MLGLLSFSCDSLEDEIENNEQRTIELSSQNEWQHVDGQLHSGTVKLIRESLFVKSNLVFVCFSFLCDSSGEDETENTERPSMYELPNAGEHIQSGTYRNAGLRITF